MSKLIYMRLKDWVCYDKRWKTIKKITNKKKIFYLVDEKVFLFKLFLFKNKVKNVL